MSFYDEEIDSVLQVYEAFPDTRDSLTVRDELEANIYMRVCQRLEAELTQLKAVKDAEVERLNVYYGARAETLEERKAFFERLVIGYYNHQRAKNPRYQLKTPWGKVTQRTTKSPTWNDETATVEWLKATGRSELVKVEESLKKADLKKVFTVANGHYVDESTGEIVPGVTVEKKTSVKVSTTDGGNNE